MSQYFKVIGIGAAGRDPRSIVRPGTVASQHGASQVP